MSEATPTEEAAVNSKYGMDDDLLTARRIWLEHNGYTTEGYQADWVQLRLGGLPLRFPNTPSRRYAIPRHDLHHVLTGYDTHWLGEAEISAWELATGCGRNAAAWTLNLTGLAMGLVMAPRRMFRAFVRGRRSENLYGRELDGLLARKRSEVRAELGLDTPPARAHAADVAAFVGWSLAGLGASALVALAIPFVTLVGLVYGLRPGTKTDGAAA